MDIELEFEFSCDKCGSDLDLIDIENGRFHGMYSLTVESCSWCLAEAEKEGMSIESEANIPPGQ